MADIFSAEPSKRRVVADEIRTAAVNTGFFYIKNHGVNEHVVEAVHGNMTQFFRQDLDTKSKVDSHKISEQAFGYKPSQSLALNYAEGVEEREAFYWRHDIENDANPPKYYTDRLKTDQFIAEHGNDVLPGVCDSLDIYSQQLYTLAKALTRTFALSLGLEESYFDQKFAYPEATITVNYYPPIEKKPIGSTEPNPVSVGAHTDFMFFTILWQDAVGGLQIVNREGQWIRATPIPGTFVVNIADYLQRITSDRYMSSIHRVQNWGGQERMSIPFFWGFGLKESCSVVESCVGEGEKPKYETISCRDWLNNRMMAMLRTTTDVIDVVE